MQEQTGRLDDETALAICTGLEAIFAHAHGLVERESLTPPSRARIETIRMIARYTLELVRSATTLSEHETQKAATRETILVVQDAPAVGQLIARLLRARDYSVIEARNGEDAIDLLREHAGPVHLVLTDVRMSGMSGGELFDQIRGWSPSLRVLFVSGDDAGDVAARLAGDDQAAFILKPFFVEDLTTAIRELINRE